MLMFGLPKKIFYTDHDGDMAIQQIPYSMLPSGLITPQRHDIDGTLLSKIVGSRSDVIPHRVNITAVDKLIVPTITAVDQAEVGGSLTNAVHGIGVAPGNIYGTAGVSALVTVTPTADKSIDITIPQVVGATYYDILLSTAEAAPLWVARITEAQRLAGCAVTAVATIGVGGSAGKVNVQVVGTGIASTAVPFVVNNAYTPEAAGIATIDCTGKISAIIGIDFSFTDLRSLPSLEIIPWFSDGVKWYQGPLQTINVLAGVTGQSPKQTLNIDVKSAVGLKLLVNKIAGQGASTNINVQLF